MSWASAVRKKAPVTAAVELVARPKTETANVDWERLVSLDFETYYDTDYTLSKLSTSEYVRDPRFKAQMVGIKIGLKKTKVVPHKNVAAELKKINWATHSLLAHNTSFDGFVLSHHYGIVPAHYYCTMSMARGLHSNEIGAGLDEVSVFYGGGGKIEGALEQTKGVLNWNKALYNNTAVYCANDVDEMFRVFVEMHKVFPAKEMDLIHMTMRMFCAPVLKVDIPRVEAEYKRELNRREELMLTTVDPRDYEPTIKEVLKTKAERELTGKERDMLIVKRVIGSNEKFVNCLVKAGITDENLPRKISPAWMKIPSAQRTEEGKWAYAFAKDDPDFISLPDRVWQLFPDLDPENAGDVIKASAREARLQQLVDLRIAVKSTTNITRAERFLKAGANGMKLPVGYAYYRAHTGRWGGNNKMNMQNLTRGGELRLSILAERGHQIAVVDSGQIEARVNGWLWDQDDLLDAFRESDAGRGLDAYCRFASIVYGREITKADVMERFVGKVCVLGLGYQMGAAKFQMTLARGALGGPKVNFPLERCHHIVNTYRRANYKIAQGWKICTQIIEDMAAGVEGSHKCISWGAGYILLPNGMTLKYPDLKKAVGEKGWDEWSYQSGAARKKIYGGLLCENLVQALARIIVAEQMLMIDEKYPVVMTTHDECATHPKTAQAAKCFAFMHKCMTTPLPWCADIPLAAEGGYDVNYSK